MNSDCLKLTCWFGERTRVEGRFFSDVLMDTFARKGVASSVLYRAVGGFGVGLQVHDDRLLTSSEDPSMVLSALDDRSVIEPLLDQIGALQPRGLLTVERARLLDDEALPDPLPTSLGEAIKLTVHLGRHDRIAGMPAYVAVCDLLRDHQVAGASVLLGVDGTSNGERVRARFFGRNVDVPTQVIVVGRGASITETLPHLRALLPRTLATIERVRVCKRDGVLLARPHPLPATDAHGASVWQKLTVYTSESHLHEGEPVHRAILQQLRHGGARGATAFRGLRGFHGDHQPHGDRLLQLGRRVPVVTTVVDTPARIADAFEVIDALTRAHGLVTSEMVPGLLRADELGVVPVRLADIDY